jgi:hypothetical protein
MDDNNRKRRQNDPSQYTSSDPRFSQDQSQGRSGPGGSIDRFRAPPALAASPSIGRGMTGAGSGYGYYGETASPYVPPLPGNNMQYQPEYGPDQRQQQNYASYNPSMLYNMSQQTPQSTVYDAPQQYQSRQPAAMQMLSEVAAPYYAAEASSASGAPVLQQASSTSSTAYQQSPPDRTPIMQGYSGAMGPMGNIGQGPPESMEQAEYASSSLDEAYATYQSALKEIFSAVKHGMLADASSSLIEVSDWLLTHVQDLGEPHSSWRSGW